MRLLIQKKILKCILDVHYIAVVLETGIRKQRIVYLCDMNCRRILHKEVKLF
jgi:hypothetical protein